MLINKHNWEMISVSNRSRRSGGKLFITEEGVSTSSMFPFEKIASTFGNNMWISMYNGKPARMKNTRSTHVHSS